MLNQTILFVPADTALPHSSHDNPQNGLPGTAPNKIEEAEQEGFCANRRGGATTGAWPGFETFCGWKGSGVSGKGGLGPDYLSRFMREQSHTIMRRPTNE
jgi:hypothetical protein